MDWMRDLAESEKSKKLSKLIIPGSHDSGAWFLDVDGPLAPNQPDVFQFAKTIVHNWSVTQDLDFLQQLQRGIRYLDFRIAPLREKGTYNIVHGLYGKEIGQQLQIIDEFLTNHPKEVVILDFSALYEFTEADHTELINMILSCFNGKLAKRQASFDNVTLNQLNEINSQAIVLYDANIDNEYLWNRSLISSPWPNVQDTASLVGFLNEEVAKDHLNLFVAQGVISPDAKTILANLASTLKQWGMEQDVENTVIGWAGVQDKQKLNIVIADFVTSHFCESIIKCNDS